MEIELLLNSDNVITGLRTNWSKTPSNKPIKKNIFTIPKSEFQKLVKFLAGRIIVYGTKKDNDYNIGKLYLKAMDNQNKEVLKGKEFWDFIKNN